MDLDTLIISVFCWLDEAWPTLVTGQRLRQRGPAPVLDDREVVTMEVVGAYLGLTQDTALFTYFRRHWAHFFPAVRQVHRTTFVRQAANLCGLKERLWQHLLTQIPHDPTFALIDSFALPVCQFARAKRCQRFAEEAAYGYDHLTRHTFYGLRFHARVCWPGVITQFELAPGNVAELDVAADLAAGTHGILLGDRNYWSPRLRAALAQQGLELVAPYRSAKRDPHPRWSRLLSRFRYRNDTVFGQLVERCGIKRVWARDRWHLANRLLRQILMHTLGVWLNRHRGQPPLHLAQLVA
jgi:hypothetical protein